MESKSESDCPYVSRGGLKLAAALEAFAIAPSGLVCADLGCSRGGFTDCLIQHGADHVYAVDTAYGELAWKLRQHPRVTVRERTNALHFDPWQDNGISGFTGCDVVTVDLGWTRQRHAVPAALRWLRRGSTARGASRIITLIKPHYESQGQAMRGGRRGVLGAQEASQLLHQVLGELPGLGVETVDWIVSPVHGSRGRAGGRRGRGNMEYLALLRPKAAEAPTA